MILVGRNHGLRVSEIIAITRDDIRDGYLTVQRGKKSKRTTQPLISSADPLLDERKSLLDFVENAQSGEPLFKLSRRQVLRIMHRHAEAAGVPHHKGTTRILKQTCGRQVAEQQGVHYAQAWLGHKSLSSTGAYTRVSSEEVAAAVTPLLGRV